LVYKYTANPTALMQSAVLLLNHIGEKAAAERLNNAIHDVYADGRSLTRDVGGSASTSQFTDAVIRRLESSSEM
jgi:isocitrate dehydrogenase (NAD+)